MGAIIRCSDQLSFVSLTRTPSSTYKKVALRVALKRRSLIDRARKLPTTQLGRPYLKPSKTRCPPFGLCIKRRAQWSWWGGQSAERIKSRKEEHKVLVLVDCMVHGGPLPDAAHWCMHNTLPFYSKLTSTVRVRGWTFPSWFLPLRHILYLIFLLDFLCSQDERAWSWHYSCRWASGSRQIDSACRFSRQASVSYHGYSVKMMVFVNQNQ